MFIRAGIINTICQNNYCAKKNAMVLWIFSEMNNSIKPKIPEKDLAVLQPKIIIVILMNTS